MEHLVSMATTSNTSQRILATTASYLYCASLQRVSRAGSANRLTITYKSYYLVKSNQVDRVCTSTVSRAPRRYGRKLRSYYKRDFLALVLILLRALYPRFIYPFQALSKLSPHPRDSVKVSKNAYARRNHFTRRLPHLDAQPSRYRASIPRNLLEAYSCTIW